MVDGGGGVGVGGKAGVPKVGTPFRGLFQKVSQMDKLSRNGNIPGPNRFDQESVHIMPIGAKMVTSVLKNI